MIQDHITPHLALPLPHPDNDLEVDVLRLRDAFSTLDSKLAAIDTLLESDDIDLDTVRELVAAIKANRADIDAVLADKATTAALAAETAARQLADSNEATARTSAIAAEAQARTDAVNAEAQARQTAINTAITAEQQARAAAITTAVGRVRGLAYFMKG